MQYTIEYNAAGGFRFDIRNPPTAGTELKTKRGETALCRLVWKLTGRSQLMQKLGGLDRMATSWLFVSSQGRAQPGEANP